MCVSFHGSSVFQSVHKRWMHLICFPEEVPIPGVLLLPAVDFFNENYCNCRCTGKGTDQGYNLLTLKYKEKKANTNTALCRKFNNWPIFAIAKCRDFSISVRTIFSISKYWHRGWGEEVRHAGKENRMAGSRENGNETFDYTRRKEKREVLNEISTVNSASEHSRICTKSVNECEIILPSHVAW